MLFTLAPTFTAHYWPLPILPVIALVLVYPSWPRARLWLLAPLVIAIPGPWAVARLPWALLLPLAAAGMGRLPRRWVEASIILASTGHGLLVLSTPWVHQGINTGRGMGYLSNPNLAGGLLALALVYALPRLLSWDFIYPACCAVALLATGSIGGLLAAASGAGYLALSAILSRFPAWIAQHKRVIVLGALAGAGGALAGLSALLAARPWWAERPGQWARALGLFVDSGGMGGGPGSFAAVALNGHIHAHNLYLHILAESGVIGLACLLALGAWLWQNNRPRGRAVIIVCAAHGLVDSVLLYPLVLLLVLGILRPMDSGVSPRAAVASKNASRGIANSKPSL